MPGSGEMAGPGQKAENTCALAVPQRGNTGSRHNQTGAPGGNPGARGPDHRRSGTIRTRPDIASRPRVKHGRTTGTVPTGHAPDYRPLRLVSGHRRFGHGRSLSFWFFRNIEDGRFRRPGIRRRFSCDSRRCDIPAVSTVGAAQPLDPLCQCLRNLKDCMTVRAFNAHSINPFDSRLRSGLA